MRPAKLAPNSPKNAKKCDLVDFSLEMVSIKALKDLEYITLSLKLSNITQTRISIIHILFLVPATGAARTSGAFFHLLIAINAIDQISQSYLAFLTILCYTNNKQTVSHHRRIQHEDNRATAHRTQK